MNEEDLEDKSCELPKLIPGDMVLLNNGEVGIITKAQVTVNGGPVQWYEELPSNIEHGWLPAYSIATKNNYKAWFTVKDFQKVITLSPLRNILKENN